VIWCSLPEITHQTVWLVPLDAGDTQFQKKPGHWESDKGRLFVEWLSEFLCECWAWAQEGRRADQDLDSAQVLTITIILPMSRVPRNQIPTVGETLSFSSAHTHRSIYFFSSWCLTGRVASKPHWLCGILVDFTVCVTLTSFSWVNKQPSNALGFRQEFLIN
jgi:hypothetical protein